MLTGKQITTLRQIYASNSGALITLIAERLIGHGVAQPQAYAAARKSIDRIWTNPLIDGPAATILGGTVFTPYAGALAGGSNSSLAGWYTLLTPHSYPPVHDQELRDEVGRITMGG
jgi:hypothetical protein